MDEQEILSSREKDLNQKERNTLAQDKTHVLEKIKWIQKITAPEKTMDPEISMSPKQNNPKKGQVRNPMDWKETNWIHTKQIDPDSDRNT